MVRILQNLAADDPTFASVLNRAELDAALTRWKGFAMVPNPEITDRPETDFLGFGCNKQAEG